jgi:1-phosphofructokinase family hexose kinase
MTAEPNSDERFDLIVASPNAALDSYYILSQVRVGDVNRADRSLHTAGGKGINLSRAVICMGGRVMSLGILGGHSGRFISEEMSRENIPGDMAWSQNETRRSATFVSTNQTLVTVVLDAGNVIEQAAADQLVKKIHTYARRAPYLVLTGSLPPALPPSYYAEIVRVVKEFKGLKVCLDCSGEPLRLAVENGAQIVKINAEEYQESFGQKGERLDPSSVYYTFQELSRSGLELLIITDGPRGSYIYPADREPFRTVTLVDQWVNTTGAGDTFLAGLLLAFNRGLAIEQAACYASAAASAKIQQIVCGSLSLDDLNHFLPLTSIKTLSEN